MKRTIEALIEKQICGEWDVFPTAVSTIVIGEERYQKSERYLFETQLFLFLCWIEALLRGRNGLSMAQWGG